MSNFTIHYRTDRFTKAQNALIERALAVAESAHSGQKRASGEPFVVHPIAVAEIVEEWGLDHEAMAAALLHDVVEDTDHSLSTLESEFGPVVAGLVDGVTKLRLSNSPRLAPESTRRPASNENLRKLLLASTKDFRVLLLKLADRLHNMRTLAALPQPKRILIATESLEIFAPLADRLGMGLLKGELEDLGFKYALPEAYENLEKQVKTSARQAERELAVLKRHISDNLQAAQVNVLQIEGRQKHHYSIYKKLVKVDGDITKIYDLVAVRVIVPDITSCYQVLGVLHQHYRPLIYRIKDYISVPKPNGYQSLHTTVFADEGRITEIQIRTPQMHEAAEYGLAAHFFYDQHKHSKQYARGMAAVVPTNLKWVEQLNSLQRSTGSEQEFVEGARLELFGDRIFVFSPKGDLYELPEGATPLDFAFNVHSGLGLRAVGARVNGRMVGLSTKLQNRDVVEVVTRREAAPNRDWLGIVVTSQARSKIKSWFRAESRDENILQGRALLESGLEAWGVKRTEDLPKRAIADALDALHLRSLDDLFVQLAEGALNMHQAIKRLIPDAARPATATVVKRPEPTGRVLVQGEDLSYAMAPCCNPVFPQSLVGFVTRGKGVTVHRFGCHNVPDEAERLVPCRWETLHTAAELIQCSLELKVTNRLGMISDITAAIATRKLSLAGIVSRPVSSKPNDPRVLVQLGIEVADLFELADVIRILETISGVEAVRRIGD